jgi:hypothetical protein
MQALAHRLSTSYPVYKKISNTLKEDESHPFSITDYFSFLGYQSKGACKRAVMNHPQADFIETQRLMNERHAPDLMLEKGFFLELARKRKNADPWIKDLSLWYKGERLRKQILQFDDSEKKRELNWLGLEEREKGNFYTYSLDTFNLAQSLELNPRDIFHLLNEKGLLSFAKEVGFKSEEIWLEAEHEKGKVFVPFASFNSLDPYLRKQFLPLLQCIYDEAKLNEEQLQLMETLAASIDDMLATQEDFDLIREEEARKLRERHEKKRHKHLRIHYKQAAKLCHPDQYENPEKKDLAHRLFVELHTAYEEKKLKEVQQIHLRAIHALGSKTDLKQYRELA